MEPYALPWDAVGMSWYVMGGTMAMPRLATKTSIVQKPG